MSLAINEINSGKIIEISLSGKLTKEDYHTFVPQIEKDIEENGKVRILLHMHDFHGWKAGALWEDLKFDIKHFADIERLAMVGDKKWEKGMAVFCRPFTKAEIRFFTSDTIDLAKEWLQQD